MTPEEFEQHKRARFERMTVTQAEGSGTELATARLWKLATRIADHILVKAQAPTQTTSPIERLVFEELQQAAFDTFREGIILADQSVVEQLAGAIATIEELQPFALLATTAMDAWAHEFHHGGRVAGLMLVGDHVLVKGPLLLIERGEEMRRRIEDLANDRAAADAEAATLRGELSQVDAVLARRPALNKSTRWENIEHAIGTASRADQLERDLAEANRNIKALNEEVEGLRNDVRQAAAAYERRGKLLEKFSDRQDRAMAVLRGDL